MRTDKLSVYLQIVEDVKRKISLGFLKSGDKLPSCRDTAIQLGINPNTVQRAYSTLEEQGFIYTIPKKGVYIADKQESTQQTAVYKIISQLKQSGATRGEVLRAVDDIYGGEL